MLALACDRIAEHGDGHDFADVLVADLADRATSDADGARWSNSSTGPPRATWNPRTGWAMGNAGIVRELLRFVRLETGRDPAYAFTWPDQPPAV